MCYSICLEYIDTSLSKCCHLNRNYIGLFIFVFENIFLNADFFGGVWSKKQILMYKVYNVCHLFYFSFWLMYTAVNEQQVFVILYNHHKLMSDFPVKRRWRCACGCILVLLIRHEKDEWLVPTLTANNKSVFKPVPC